ncbi:MAG UNVERIFIED_CONTAM: hypothetical protein LVR29_24860, partial [Microcystis novacekii LVE1205-3]
DSHPVGSLHGGNQGIDQILTVRIEKITESRCFCCRIGFPNWVIVKTCVICLKINCFPLKIILS